jgi:hypothetical protein
MPTEEKINIRMPSYYGRRDSSVCTLEEFFKDSLFSPEVPPFSLMLILIYLFFVLMFLLESSDDEEDWKSCKSQKKQKAKKKNFINSADN